MKKKNLQIISVFYLQNYELKLLFQDGKESIVDFYGFLNSSTNPQIKSYLDIKKFKSFKLQDGELLWGDFDLLFPIHDLYLGKLSA